MSRTIIGAIVALAIAALTVVVYVVVTGGLAERVRKDARSQMQPGRVPQQALNNARLDLLNLSSSVEQLSADDGVVATLKADNPRDRLRESDLAFQRFRARSAQPDVLAILDATGNILVMDGINNPIATELKGKDGKLVWRGLAYALDGSSAKRRTLAEFWNYPGRGLMRVGIASVIDVETADGVPKVAGAVLVGYAQSSKLARLEATTLGSEVAYFDAAGGKVHATSFADAKMNEVLAPLLGREDLTKKALAAGDIVSPVRLSVGGNTYYAAAIPSPRFPPAKQLPTDYPPVSSGLLVLAPASPAVAEHGTAGNLILVLGGVALLLALGAMWLSSRRILDQVDEIEVGVAEIINGNLERTFRPVGDDLDGLANGLNVMLARLLGRPEPGEEEMDDDGNPIVSGRVDFDDDAEAAAAASSSSAELAALAQEPEPDYYKRVYTEYRDARRAVGNPDEVSFEGFIAKLRVNEGKLKAQHHCKSVRFRVVTKDGKVSLKPVPIF
jgi:hypothetical protein